MIRCFTIFRIYKYSIHFVLYFYLIHDIVIYFLPISFAQYKKYVIYLISFSKFSDVLPAFPYARAIGTL